MKGKRRASEPTVRLPAKGYVERRRTITAPPSFPATNAVVFPVDVHARFQPTKIRWIRKSNAGKNEK